MNLRPRRDDRGQVAGIEAVPFGIAVFVGLTLVIVNGWAQINARGVADSMAREYLRAYTQSTSSAAAHAAGDRAVARVVAAHQLGATRVSVDAPTVFAPCDKAEVTVALEIPAVRIPFIGTLGSAEVRAVQRDRIDAYRILEGGGTLAGSDCDG